MTFADILHHFFGLDFFKMRGQKYSSLDLGEHFILQYWCTYSYVWKSALLQIKINCNYDNCWMSSFCKGQVFCCENIITALRCFQIAFLEIRFQPTILVSRVESAHWQSTDGNAMSDEQIQFTSNANFKR